MAQEPFRGKQEMSDATVTDAAGWADALLAKVYRGPGDTVEAAMYRAEAKYGIPASTFFALRYRRPKDILASVYLRLQAAYDAECARQTAKLRHEIEMTKRVMGNAAPDDLIREAEAVAAQTG